MFHDGQSIVRETEVGILLDLMNCESVGHTDRLPRYPPSTVEGYGSLTGRGEELTDAKLLKIKLSRNKRKRMVIGVMFSGASAHCAFKDGY